MEREHEPRPDVEIAATVRAEELRFHAQPSAVVSFSSRRGSGQETARENIESPVEPGRVYRRIRVATRITGRLRSGEAAYLQQQRDATRLARWGYG